MTTQYTPAELLRFPLMFFFVFSLYTDRIKMMGKKYVDICVSKSKLQRDDLKECVYQR